MSSLHLSCLAFMLFFYCRVTLGKPADPETATWEEAVALCKTRGQTLRSISDVSDVGEIDGDEDVTYWRSSLMESTASKCLTLKISKQKERQFASDDCKSHHRFLCTNNSFNLLIYIGVGCLTFALIVCITVCVVKRSAKKRQQQPPPPEKEPICNSAEPLYDSPDETQVQVSQRSEGSKVNEAAQKTPDNETSAQNNPTTDASPTDDTYDQALLPKLDSATKAEKPLGDYDTADFPVPPPVLDETNAAVTGGREAETTETKAVSFSDDKKADDKAPDDDAEDDTSAADAETAGKSATMMDELQQLLAPVSPLAETNDSGEATPVAPVNEQTTGESSLLDDKDILP